MSPDQLELFLGWWAESRNLEPPKTGAIEFAEGVTAITLYREDNFQVQMIIVPPNHVIPPHTHPDVDSFEVFFTGDITFYINGKIPEESPELGAPIRVRPDDVHSGEFGPAGGAFLSIQRWLNGIAPTSVGYNWMEPATDRKTGSASPVMVS